MIGETYNNYLDRFGRFFDRFLERLDQFQDYLFAVPSVTVTEVMMLWLAMLWSIWMLLFDVAKTSVVFRYMWSKNFWCACFGAAALVHIGGIVFKFPVLRSWAAYGYAVIWTVWMMMAAFANYQALGVPVFGVFTVVSAILAVRLSR
jgi:hypothetical protein